jgi:hypothetical protein
MTDEELLEKTSKARGNAHRSELSEWSLDHKGHSSIVNHETSWASRGHDFMALSDECAKRGLKLPPCDCPPGAHDWEKGKSK